MNNDELYGLIQKFIKSDEDSIDISNLLKITQIYSKKWHKFREMIDKKLKVQTSEVTKVDIFEFNEKRYLILTYATMKFMIIDIDSKSIVFNKSIIPQYVDEDDIIVLKKLSMKESFHTTEYCYDIIGEEDLVDTDLENIVNYVNEYPFLLENIDFNYLVEFENCSANLFFDISTEDFVLSFQYSDGEILNIYLDKNMNIENLGFLRKQECEYISKELKNIKIPKSLIPSIYLKH